MHKLELAAVSTLLVISSVIAVEPLWAADDQAAAPGDTTLQEVDVSASRIAIQGYSQPTPVTVVGLPQLQSEARTDIADVIDRLPEFGPGGGPNISQNNITNGSEGIDDVNLRNLGTIRTLILFDGQRVVNSNIAGGVDMSTIPSSLVERVDVVTGGASAAWGSDAVAGVVNLVINHNFNGVQINAEDSDNWENQHPQRKFDLTLGTVFDGGRGHVEFGGTYLSAPKPFFSEETQGFAYQRLMPNPNYAAGCGCPQYVHATNVGLYQETPGGIITGTYNAAGTTVVNKQSTGGPLINTYFEGPSATPLQFVPGVVSNGAWTWNGTQNTQEGDYELDAFPLKEYNGMGLADFKLTDSVTATLQLDYGYNQDQSDSYSDDHYATIKINSGNPYIPASIQQVMTANGIGALQMGDSEVNPSTGNGGDLGSLYNTIGIPVAAETRELYRGVFSLDGTITDNWKWNAYVQHSEVWTHLDVLNNVSEPAFTNAVNAVTVTAANRGTSGLTIGTITCASNLLPVGNAGRTTNCAPLDIFGSGAGIASQAAINYVNGDARAGDDQQETTLTQNVAEASLRGKLPFGTSAGPVAVAAGVDYRKEKGVAVSTYQAGVLKEFSLGDFPYFWGEYSTKEGFVEVNAPLLKDQIVKDLSIDVAGRVTDYSTSGTVKTYKVGLTSQLVDPVRLRASYSYDIRAPQLSELYNQGTPVLGSAIDPHTGISVSEFTTAEGNVNLKPENSETRTAGLVFTPIRGLNASLDWYYIRVNGLIASPSTSVILAKCAAGFSAYCADLVFNGPGGALSAILAIPGNLNWETVSGLDFQADYKLPVPVMNGALGLNVVGNYEFEQTTDNLGTLCDGAGSAGAGAQPCSGLPKLHATIGETYSQGAWLATIEQRMIGQWLNNNSWQTGVQIDDNKIPMYIYWDLRASYKWDNGVQVYGALDNALDKYPPVIVSTATANTSLFESPFRNSVYDTFGRVWRLGIRAKF